MPSLAKCDFEPQDEQHLKELAGAIFRNAAPLEAGQDRWVYPRCLCNLPLRELHFSPTRSNRFT